MLICPKFSVAWIWKFLYFLYERDLCKGDVFFISGPPYLCGGDTVIHVLALAVEGMFVLQHISREAINTG